MCISAFWEYLTKIILNANSNGSGQTCDGQSHQDLWRSLKLKICPKNSMTSQKLYHKFTIFLNVNYCKQYRPGERCLVIKYLDLHCSLCFIYRTFRHNTIVGPQNAPLHNMLLLVAYCVPCIHNMLHWSILCTLHTQYATSGAYCVGSIHMLFQWSSEGTQYALLENMSRGICLSF